MKDIKVGNLVRFQYSNSDKALGVVTWEEGNKFKAIWSDGNPYKEMKNPLDKYTCITGVWEVINYTKEETKMNTYKEAKELISKVIGDSKTIKGNDGLGTTTITQIEDKLTVAQEAMNNAFMSVQGILQAHADKNGEDIPELDTELRISGVELSKIKRTEFAKGYDKATKMYFDGFNFSDFDKSVKRTWKKQDFKDAVSNAALGLTGEAGEVADLIKKGIYHDRGFSDLEHKFSKPVRETDVKDELSDVLFYVSAMSQEFGFTLEEVALHNKAKLEKRYNGGFTVEESARKADKIKEYFTDMGRV